MRGRTIVFGSVCVTLIAAIALVAVRQQPAAMAGAGPSLILYWEDDFEGRSLELTDTAADLPEVKDAFGNTFNWNDQVRSVVVVSGTWRLWQNGRCNTKLD